MKQPCADCPWRQDAPTGHWHPDHFVSIWQSCQDDGMAFMLCHKSRPAEGVRIPCAGYVLVVGFASIGLRLECLAGRLDPRDYDAGGVALYATFADMLRANGVRLPRRNRVKD